MTVLIIGHPDSGKSKLAEELVTDISAQGERIYLATMIPYGNEGCERIEKHRQMRAGKGFVTIEAPFDIADALETAFLCGSAEASASDPEEPSGSSSAACGKLRKSTVLLECLSNLVANEMFERQTDPEMLTKKITNDILELSSKVRDLVIVSNHFEITEGFDEDTIRYAELMDEINSRISVIASETIRI